MQGGLHVRGASSDEEDEGSYDVQTTHEIPSNMKIEQYSLKWLLNEESPIHTILLDEINL